MDELDELYAGFTVKDDALTRAGYAAQSVGSASWLLG